MKVRVRLLDPQRMAISEELMEVTSVAELGSVLADGRKVLSAEPVAGQAQRRLRPASARAQSLDVAWWCQELRTLLQAGMTVVEAIETLQAQSAPGSDRAALQSALLTELHRGKALSVAMESLERFPMVLVASVRASERSSSLAEALTEYLRYHDLVEALRKKVVSAAIYPSLVLGLGLLVSTFLVIVVLPRFASMYADLHGSMSWTTEMLTVVSRFMREYRWAVVVGLVGLVAAVVGCWRQGLVQRASLAAGMRVGVIRRALREFQLAKLYHSMTVMFRGGYTLDEALLRCEGLALGSDLERGMREARSALHRGVRVSAALTEAGMTDTVTQRLLAVGERSGQFERVLQTIADRHATNFSAFMDRATRIVEPMMLLLVSLLVGSIVVLMYLPIFDIASSIR
ncbi:type II secretion system F family protein [Roseateles sp. SL47]|uniref:type II secretion system F family protein n=1 Tax=Roseateles sp. SL47 TaxID=2995138 RepID=UPI002271BA9A|nr:type II secretion system F family protein [Roseateles sp. SL47]WAC72440.1 type II secretion system F family protein [Roseateles sp. SL47]